MLSLVTISLVVFALLSKTKTSFKVNTVGKKFSLRLMEKTWNFWSPSKQITFCFRQETFVWDRMQFWQTCQKVSGLISDICYESSEKTVNFLHRNVFLPKSYLLQIECSFHNRRNAPLTIQEDPMFQLIFQKGWSKFRKIGNEVNSLQVLFPNVFLCRNRMQFW